MQIDINSLPNDIQYKLISSTIVPRPIALITTYNDDTGDNAAPFSFFNAMGENPPVVVVGLETRRHSRTLKDTTHNVMHNGQFVVHLVDEGLGEAIRNNFSSLLARLDGQRGAHRAASLAEGR